MDRRTVSLVLGCLAFVFILGSTVAVLHADDYNTGQGWCASHDFLDNPGFWLMYECWKPERPSPPM